MPFTVKFFGYRGFKQIPTIQPHQHFDNVQQGFWQPYEWRQSVDSDGANPVSTNAQAAPDLTKLLFVEIPAGSSIRYEVCPPSSARVPDASSPLMAASDWVPFEAGWTFKFIEAA